MDLIENDSAVAKVFAIPELVESILLFLPWYDLFVFKRVNRTFDFVLQRSKVLQNTMSMNWLGETDKPVISECIWDTSWSDFSQPLVKTNVESDTIIRLAYEPTMDPSPSGSQKRRIVRHKFLGIGTWQQGVANGHGSWRQLRMSTLAGTIKVLVDVKLKLEPGSENYKDLLRTRRNRREQWYEGYLDETLFDSLTVTLGNVADVLLKILERSQEDHLSRAIDQQM